MSALASNKTLQKDRQRCRLFGPPSNHKRTYR